MVEGAPHTAKRSRDQLLCLEVPPAPIYKGPRGRGRPARGGRAREESYSPLFLVGVGGGKEGKERGGRKGGAAPLLVQFGLEGEGGAACPGRPSSSPLRPNRPITLPGGFR